MVCELYLNKKVVWRAANLLRCNLYAIKCLHSNVEVSDFFFFFCAFLLFRATPRAYGSSQARVG